MICWKRREKILELKPGLTSPAAPENIVMKKN
jgi:hypothetical protein